MNYKYFVLTRNIFIETIDLNKFIQSINKCHNIKMVCTSSRNSDAYN